MNAKIDTSDVQLETKRLLLRPWQITDLKDFNEYASQPGVCLLYTSSNIKSGNRGCFNNLRSSNGINEIRILKSHLER